MTDTFAVIEKGGKFYVKNLKTGKVGSNVFRKRENAEIQRKNRERFIKLMNKKTKNPPNKNKGKNKSSKPSKK